MPVDGRRVFTEMFEVVQNELVREAASGEESKYKGMINQIYSNDLTSVLPERYIKKQAFITTAAEYTTGTVTVGTGTAGIQGAGTTWTSAHTDSWIKVDGYDELFRVTYSADTLLTLQDSLSWVGSSGSGIGYTLFQDRYAVASDFAYLAKENPDSPNSVYYYSGNARLPLTPWSVEEYERNVNGTVGDPSQYTVKWVSGAPYLHIWPGSDSTQRIVGYFYVPRLTQLRELTTGTASLSGASGTALVLTSNASMTASVDSSRTLYFRNDADGTGSDSVWGKISTVTNASVGSLQGSQAFGITSGTGLTYTISEVSEWPERFDDTMMYKSAMIVDPDNAQLTKWTALSAESLGIENSVETKRKRGHKLKRFPGAR